MLAIAIVSVIATAIAVVATLAWLVHRAYEEIQARRHHVCWIDDTSCAWCAPFDSFSEYTYAQEGR
jgi:hypothetical protein